VNSTTPTAAGVVAGIVNERLFGTAPPLQRALAVAATGLPIVPMHTASSSGICDCRRGKGCRKAGKHPRIKSWQQNGTIDPAKIRDWWQQWPAAEYAVVTGNATGIDQGDMLSVIVLDFDKGVDGRCGGLQTLQSLQWRGLEDGQTIQGMDKTMRVATPGGGWHLYFLAPPGVSIPTRQRILPGLDIRADGGCAVGPWVQRGGKQYQPFNKVILPLPPALLQLLTGPPAAGRRDQAAAGSCHTRGTQPPGGLPAEAAPGAVVTQEGHKRDTRQTQEALKRSVGVPCCEKNKINFEALPNDVRQRAVRIMVQTLPAAAGTRHRQVFDLARGLRSLPGWWDIDVATLTPFVRTWQQRAEHTAADLGFTINGDFLETWQDFRDAWGRIKKPAGKNMTDTVEQCRQTWLQAQRDGVAQLPEQVADVVEQLQLADQFSVALVLLCWGLQQQWPNGQFPLDVRTAAKQVAAIRGVADDGEQYKTAHRRLQALCNVGVIDRVAVGKRGRASEFLWCGAPAAAAGAAPTWLASGQW